MLQVADNSPPFGDATGSMMKMLNKINDFQGLWGFFLYCTLNFGCLGSNLLFFAESELPKLLQDRGGLGNVKTALREMARNQTMGIAAFTAEIESLKEDMRRGFGTMIAGLNGVARLVKDTGDPAIVRLFMIICFTCMNKRSYFASLRLAD